MQTFGLPLIHYATIQMAIAAIFQVRTVRFERVFQYTSYDETRAARE